MRKLWIIIGLTFSAMGCGPGRDAVESKPPSLLKNLESAYADWVAKSQTSRDESTGWLIHESCDAMLYNGLWASSPGIDGVDITASEYPDQPGRFGRRPPPRCWTPDGGDMGSKTTWSRDMAKGLFIWAYRKNELSALERHASYGKSVNWKMGEPLDDGRAVYTPSTIGELYQIIFSLGGEDSANRVWPGIYSKKLRDFQAHLQILSIYIRGSIAERFNDADAMPKKPDDSANLTDISGTMYNRIVEHAERETSCPFYQYMAAVYGDGDLNDTTKLLLGDWDCEYMRDEPNMRLAVQTFVGGLILERVGWKPNK